MEITKEFLQAKRLEYEETAAHYKALAEANLGAAQAIDSVLGELSRQEPEAKPPKNK
jgi:rubrerythrin